MGFATPVIQRLGNRDCTVATYGATTKFCYPTAAGSFSVQKLATDPISVTSVTFDGVVAGSEIHVYLPDGTEVAGVESCVAKQSLSWPVYAAGNPNNDVFITIIKRGLRWMKFAYTSKIGAQSIPIFQSPDLGYNNPA